jgi:hypothetical protein
MADDNGGGSGSTGVVAVLVIFLVVVILAVLAWRGGWFGVRNTQSERQRDGASATATAGGAKVVAVISLATHFF